MNWVLLIGISMMIFGFALAFISFRKAANIQQRLMRLDLRTGVSTPVEETDSGRLWAKIATNYCPDCGGEGFYEGPSGGMSTNIYCANETCGARFNVTPAIGIAERI